MSILSFQGRIKRSGFFWISLLPYLIILVALLIHLVLGFAINNEKSKIITIQYKPYEQSAKQQTTNVSTSSETIVSDNITETTKDTIDEVSNDLDMNEIYLNPLFPWFILCAFVAWLILTWIYLAATVKRLHDLGQTGWMALINLLPGAGLIMWVFLIFAKGQEVDNAYGPVPR